MIGRKASPLPIDAVLSNPAAFSGTYPGIAHTSESTRQGQVLHGNMALRGFGGRAPVAGTLATDTLTNSLGIARAPQYAFQFHDLPAAHRPLAEPPGRHAHGVEIHHPGTPAARQNPHPCGQLARHRPPRSRSGYRRSYTRLVSIRVLSAKPSP